MSSMRQCSLQTPLGDMIARLDDNALSGLWFVDQRHGPNLDSSFCNEPEHPLFQQLKKELDSYFAGSLCRFSLPLAPRGTKFRQAVWRLLLNIPAGSSTSYGALASQLASQQGCGPSAARAVGGAVGHNPISIIIPCHRVLGADGSLTGYAGGLVRKQYLLDLERTAFGNRSI